jgi:hypothetical protein
MRPSGERTALTLIRASSLLLGPVTIDDQLKLSAWALGNRPQASVSDTRQRAAILLPDLDFIVFIFLLGNMILRLLGDVKSYHGLMPRFQMGPEGCRGIFYQIMPQVFPGSPIGCRSSDQMFIQATAAVGVIDSK